MKTVTKIALPLIILGAGYAAMMIFLGLRSDPPPRTHTARSKVVQAYLVDLSPVVTEITAYGRVVSAQRLELFSEVAGEVITGEVEFQPAVAPPSIGSATPVRKLASSEARKQTASATSRGSAIRPIGIPAADSRLPCSTLIPRCRKSSSIIGVFVSVGHTALTRTPSRAWSRAIARVSRTRPPLLAQ